MPQVEWKMN